MGPFQIEKCCRGTSTMSTLKLIGGMFALVLVGAPLVWYLWEVLTQLLSGVINTTSLLIALPVLIVFLVFLRFVSRTVQRWNEQELS
jgi:nitrogen fixation/metabolism regulation signal transduction histidine kinase